MYKLIFALLLLVSISAQADDWSTGDTYRESAFQTLLALDFLQTRNISKSSNYCGVGKQNEHPNCHYVQEMNNYLGACPTLGAINRYFLVGSALHAGIAYLLPEKYRAPFQYVTIGVEAGYVAHNFSIGIGVKF